MCLAYHQTLASDVIRASNLYLQLSKQILSKPKQIIILIKIQLPPRQWKDKHLAGQVFKAITEDKGKILKITFLYAFCKHCKQNHDEQVNHLHAICPA